MLMSSDDTALIFYSLILIIVLGSFLFGDFRNRLSQSLRHAAIWILIFLSAVTLYGFRDTIEAQLFPASAVMREGEDIILTRARDGHFYATLDVNGAPVRFVVDTGATGIVLSRRDAEQAGFDIDALVFSGRARTANGPVQTAFVRLDTLEFAGRRDAGLRASVNGGQLDTSLLGMDYLGRFDRIEISGQTLRLVP